LQELLDKEAIKFLKDKKNLLAFSGGSDSTALFFMLLEETIDFDIAIVNYKLRKEADLEVCYAKELAKKYNKKIFIKETSLTPPSIEKKARDIRYQFFEEIIKKENYHTLITAHQLNDQTEWFLMQFSKGAGLVELIGMDLINKKENFNIVRPLLYTSKKDILNYLKEKNIKFFFDISNLDISYKRNYFRKEFVNKLIDEFEKGIRNSFKYLHQDKELILEDLKFIKIKDLFISKNQNSDIKNIRVIDKIVKNLGILLSSKQKEEILKQKEGVLSSKVAIAIKKDCIFIAPFIKTVMDKNFKERCRILKIPPNIRGYIYKENIELDSIQNYIQQL